MIANASYQDFAQIICDEMESSAKARGTGIAKRSPDYIKEKMREGKAVIAFTEEGIWAGFCYIETWSHGEYVANSGLIVAPPFRKSGLAKNIKKKIFDLSQKLYPNAKLFGLTTGLAVMKIKQWGMLKNLLRKEKVDMILSDLGLIRLNKFKKEKLAK